MVAISEKNKSGIKQTLSTSKLKGGSFLITQTDANSVFTPEDFTEEQQMIAQMVRDFCEQEIVSIGIEKLATLDPEKDLDLIVGVLEKAGELGLCGLAIEEEYGGLDLDFNTGLIFSEVIALGFCFATTIGAQTSIGSLPIVYYGTSEQKAKYLPGIATGEIKAAYCLTEPTAGSDANSGKTKATLSENGTHYLLSGQKMWITNGGFADVFIVFAKIDDDENLSAFIVEKAFGGITIGKEEKKLGIKGSSTVQLFFENCPVPVENLLSDRQAGFKIALNILNTGRIKLAAGTVGGSKFAITQATAYAAQRKQFDKVIADFGAIKHKIGEMTTRTFAEESALYRTGYNIDQKYKELAAAGASPSEAKLQAIREYAIECAILKVHASELIDYVIDETLQIHGGMGYAVETGIEMGYRDARITRIYEGTNEINRMLSVGELMKRAFKTKEVDLMTSTKNLPFHLLKQARPFKSSKGFSEEHRIVENIKSTFLLISGAAGRKLKLKLVDEQEIIMNLADILAEAYIAESMLLRVEKLASTPNIDQEKVKIQRKMLQLYLYEALAKVRKAGEDAIASYATGVERAAMFRSLGLLTPRYDINPKAHRREIADFVIRHQEYCF